jgi:hypothetical protein
MEGAASNRHNLSELDAFVSELETRGWNIRPPREYGATYDLGRGEVVMLSPHTDCIVLESNRLPPDPWGTVVIDPASQQVRSFTTMAREGDLQVVYISAPLATFRQVAGPILGEPSTVARPTTQRTTAAATNKPIRGIG